ncbi:MAG: hypothetical protein IJ678_05755, partial [Kiritimatiellae bacterium]|nr:hypothetical protein [Kiritimatiellia bacterium]
MILNKTRLGLDVFDRTFGGIYFGRATAVSGPRNGDKTLVAAQFANKVFQTGERVCVICDHSLDDFFLDLRSLGADPNAVIATGQMAVLSCAGIATQGGDTPFRPSGECIEDLDAALHELTELATERGFPFFVFNTVLPWIAAAPVAEGVLRTDKFVTALERVGATSLLLMPRPVSQAAKKLGTALEMRCAAAIRMSADESGARTMRVVRYGKDSAVALPASYQLTTGPGKGLVSAEAAAQADSRHLDSFAATRRRPPRSGKSADGEKRFRPLIAPGAMI